MAKGSLASYFRDNYECPEELVMTHPRANFGVHPLTTGISHDMIINGFNFWIITYNFFLPVLFLPQNLLARWQNLLAR